MMFDFNLQDALQTTAPTVSRGRFDPEEVTIERGNLDHLEQMLRHRLAIDPDRLSAYFALYKLLFRQSRLEEAANTALLAIAVSARLGRFSAVWQKLTPDVADWADTQSPAHFYLFTMKALSFIRLRQGQIEDCRSLLAKIQELDPNDLVGASVIRSYADGADP